MIQNPMKEREMKEMKPMCRPENIRPVRPFGPDWFTPFFNDFFTAKPWSVEHSLPAMNVLENEKAYTVQLAVPGMTKEDFNISLDTDDTLVVRTTRKCGRRDNEEGEKEACEKRRPHFLRREFGYVRFEESFALPEDVDKEAINATVENGMLTIELPKKSADDLANLRRVIAIQ